MQGRMIGVDEQSGVSCPDLEKIAYAYGIKFIRIHNLVEMKSKIQEMQEADEAVICEIMTPENQLLQPRVASKQLPNGQMVSMAYDNMFPFLSEEEYQQNKII
jgi:acetolactate synthase-1/2/3 large subunit